MLKEPYNKERLRKRLNAKRIIKGGHWLWTGCLAISGHGRISVSGKVYFTSRLSAFVYLNFDLESDLQINHKIECSIPNCFNPDHLYVGTQTDNRKDDVARGISGNQHSIKTHCRYGHILLNDNLMIIRSKDGIHRRCRICHRKQVREAATRLRFRRRRKI